MNSHDRPVTMLTINNTREGAHTEGRGAHVSLPNNKHLQEKTLKLARPCRGVQDLSPLATTPPLSIFEGALPSSLSGNEM